VWFCTVYRFKCYYNMFLIGNDRIRWQMYSFFLVGAICVYISYCSYYGILCVCTNVIMKYEKITFQANMLLAQSSKNMNLNLYLIINMHIISTVIKDIAHLFAYTALVPIIYKLHIYLPDKNDMHSYRRSFPLTPFPHTCNS
jgi:hypothetical protein